MGATLTNITPYMKEVYQGRIREQLNSDTKTLKRIMRSSAGVTSDVGGKYVTFPVHTTRNSGIGSRNELEPLPVPGQQGHAAARIGLKYAYGSIELSGQAISLSDTDTKAFAKALDTEVNGLKTDIQKDMNRQIYGNGSGAIGTSTTVAAGTNNVVVSDARLFQKGAVVDLVTLPSTIVAAARTITAINLATNTITLSGAVFTTAVGQIIVRTGSLGREITGFGAIVNDSGTLYNIDPTVEDVWKAEVDANGGVGRALSEGRMIQMADRIRSNGGKTTVIFQSLGVRRAYFALLSQQRQVVNEQKFTGGFTGLAFTTDDGEIPVVADVDAPLGTQFFINEEAITFYRDEEWHWLDRNGSMWNRKTDANGVYDAYYANLVEYHELGTDRRNTHGVIRDLTEA